MATTCLCQGGCLLKTTAPKRLTTVQEITCVLCRKCEPNQKSTASVRCASRKVNVIYASIHRNTLAAEDGRKLNVCILLSAVEQDKSSNRKNHTIVHPNARKNTCWLWAVQAQIGNCGSLFQPWIAEEIRSTIEFTTAALLRGMLAGGTLVPKNFLRTGTDWELSWSFTSSQDLTFCGSTKFSNEPSWVKLQKEPKCACIFGVHCTSGTLVVERGGVVGAGRTAISDRSFWISLSNRSSCSMETCWSLAPSFPFFFTFLLAGEVEEEEEDDVSFLAFFPLPRRLRRERSWERRL